MTIRHLHSWDLSIGQAMALQRSLRAEVSREEPRDLLREEEVLVAGLDCHYPAGSGWARAAASLVRWFPGRESLEVLQTAVVEVPVRFPYVPGLLSFREAPPLAAVLERLDVSPDLLLCDGHGLAHPRRFGLASHVGLLAGVPTIGVAKQRLIGAHAWLEGERGNWQPLLDDREVIGAVLRTRSWVAPVYVSIGHLITLPSALRAVLALASSYRLPEPARLAHQAATGG
jgi:deoxyribonuclease V